MTPSRGRPRDAAARERIVAVASERFVRDGYLATTTSAVAAEAKVSVTTIYAAFGSKLGLLAAVHDHAVAGDAEPVPLLERSWVLALQHARSVRGAWQEAADRLAASTARVAPLIIAIQQAAATPDVAELLRDLRSQRRRFSRALVGVILDLPDGDPRRADNAADVLYATMSAETYALLVVECGWTQTRWRDWAGLTVERALTGP